MAGPISRFFETVPLSEAHVVRGNAVEGKLPAHSLDVLVWNVKKGDRPLFDSEFKKFGADKELFLIQEAYTAGFFTDTLDAFKGYQWDLGLSFRYKRYNNDATGNMIGAIVKPTWVKVEHTFNLEPVTKTPKATIYAKFAVEGFDKELLVISMHGINFNGLNAYLNHLAQVRAVIAAHRGPVFLAGDFNTRTDEREVELRAFAASLRLKEVELINGDGRMQSYGSKHYLDYAFVKGLTVKHAEVFESKGSDHQPMEFSLDVL